jgi:hypothetical protein
VISQSPAESQARPARRRVYLLGLLSVLNGCSVYEPSLLQPQGSSGTGGHAQGAAGGCSEQAGPSSAACNQLDGECIGASDTEHCGLANANSVCVAGQCVIASCKAGHLDCDGLASNGCEATLDSNGHGGACNVLCARQNSAANCDGDDAGCELAARGSDGECPTSTGHRISRSARPP